MSFDNLNYVLMNYQNSALNVTDILSNNAANVNTPGFKEEKVLFDTFLHQATNKETVSFGTDIASYHNHNQGQFSKTDNEFDFAIEGKGYFMVSTPQGERYTKAGNFRLNSAGVLVTMQGHPVLSPGGDLIFIPEEAREFKVDNRANIMIDGQITGRIGVAYYANEALLRPVGNNFFEALGQPIISDDYKVYQGMLELSNVEPISNMTKLINEQRNVSVAADLINISDDMEKSAFKVFSK